LKTLYITIVAFAIIFQQTNNLQTQWVQTNAPIGFTARSLLSKDTRLFAGVHATGVMMTTNFGANWELMNSGLPVFGPGALLLVDSNIFAAMLASVYFTSNNGLNWINKSNGLQAYNYQSLSIIDQYIFTASYPSGGVWRTSNNGENWHQVVNGLYFHDVFCSAVSGSILFVGTGTGGVRLTTDYGENWEDASNGLPENSDVISILATGNTIFASTVYNLYSSSNNGSNWIQVGGGLPLNYAVTCLVNSGTSIFAAVSSKGIFVTTNNGLNWNSVNSGFPVTSDVRSFAIHGSYLFAGTQSGIWRRPLSEMIALQPISSLIPKSFSLDQNYPNPFNPETKIRFSVPNDLDDAVKLFVCDILGREVSTLVNEELKPGIYEATFDSEKNSSGVYFYTLSSGKYKTTKKLVILK
jgi:photosystem II stability/assembly factor-like uncharacterized protein